MILGMLFFNCFDHISRFSKRNHRQKTCFQFRETCLIYPDLVVTKIPTWFERHRSFWQGKGRCRIQSISSIYLARGAEFWDPVSSLILKKGNLWLGAHICMGGLTLNDFLNGEIYFVYKCDQMCVCVNSSHEIVDVSAVLHFLNLPSGND